MTDLMGILQKVLDSVSEKQDNPATQEKLAEAHAEMQRGLASLSRMFQMMAEADLSTAFTDENPISRFMASLDEGALEDFASTVETLHGDLPLILEGLSRVIVDRVAKEPMREVDDHRPLTPKTLAALGIMLATKGQEQAAKELSVTDVDPQFGEATGAYGLTVVWTHTGQRVTFGIPAKGGKCLLMTKRRDPRWGPGAAPSAAATEEK